MQVNNIAADVGATHSLLAPFLVCISGICLFHKCSMSKVEVLPSLSAPNLSLPVQAS